MLSRLNDKEYNVLDLNIIKRRQKYIFKSKQIQNYVPTSRLN
jgi:hypothetical protein